VWDPTASIELVDSGLNLIELPAFRLDEGGDRRRGQKRLRVASSFRERLEALLHVGIDADG
jgi:hypothetical protein